MDIGKVEMLGSWTLQGRDALTATADRLCPSRCRICRRAIRHVSISDVGATRWWRVVQLVVEAEGRSAADSLRRADALAVRVGSRIVRCFRVERAVAEQRVGALAALLLEALRAHRPEEAMCGQRNVSPARRRRRPALGAHAARQADATLHAASSPAGFCPRPSVLAARVRSRNGRRSRRRQARLSSRPRHAEHAAPARVARLVGRRHGQGVAVVVAVAVVTSCMTSTKEGRGFGGRMVVGMSDWRSRSVGRATGARVYARCLRQMRKRGVNLIPSLLQGPHGSLGRLWPR